MSLDSLLPWNALQGGLTWPACLLFVALATAAKPAPKPVSVHDFKVRAMDGREVPLSDYAGKLVLVVNTASRCGLTPQYEGLEALADRYRARGFEVLAFPANDFMGQEPGTDAEIREFCRLKYDVSFPVFSKLHVKGDEQHPLYAFLTEKSQKPGPVKWNFTKFLVDPQGRVVERFEPKVDPSDKLVVQAIESRLPAK